MSKHTHTDSGATRADKKNSQASLISSSYGGREFIGVDLPYRGARDVVARQLHFFDQVLALADLPDIGDLPKILKLSELHNVPSVWRRARPSILESDVAALLTALSFSHHTGWVKLIRQFCKRHSLKIGLRGRPRIAPKQRKDFTRGIQIERWVVELNSVWPVKEALAAKLKLLGLGRYERVLDAKTIEDAACQAYFAAHRGDESNTLKAVQNSYARYKKLLRQV